MKSQTLNYTTAYQYYAHTTAKTPQNRAAFAKTFQNVLQERVPEDLDVTIKRLDFKVDDRIYVELEGKNKDDLVFCSTLLKEITGEVINARNVPKDRPLFGTIRGSGTVGFGIFVDVGIEGPTKEVLIPLFQLRKDLVADQKLSVKEIIAKYGLIDYVPVEIEVTKIEYEKGGKPRFEGKFSDRFLAQIRGWVAQGNEIVFTTGMARQFIKRTLAKRSHTVDIVQVQRIGPLETAIICKNDTTAPGILAHIGPFLPHCRLAAFRPANLTRYWKK